MHTQKINISTQADRWPSSRMRCVGAWSWTFPHFPPRSVLTPGPCASCAARHPEQCKSTVELVIFPSLSSIKQGHAEMAECGTVRESVVRSEPLPYLHRLKEIRHGEARVHTCLPMHFLWSQVHTRTHRKCCTRSYRSTRSCATFMCTHKLYISV